MVMEKSSINDDEKVICSSIVMLQERFKQLEKVKEMREERELLKLISSTNNNNNNKILQQQCNSSTPSYDHHYSITTCSNKYLYDPLPPSSKLFFNSEIIFPTRQLDCQLLSLSLSLWPNSHHPSYNCTSNSNSSSSRENTQTNCNPSWLTDVSLSHPPSLFQNINLETSIVNSDVDTTLHL